MPIHHLPADPSLIQLDDQARELQRRIRTGERRALSLFVEHYPDGDPTQVPLHLARVLTARHYGFSGWPRLTAHVELVHRLSSGVDDDSTHADPADHFLTNAVLRYDRDDGPSRWRVAGDLLAADPTIAARTVHTASACADHVAVQRFLVGDPALASRPGGPLHWEPLLYLAYARHVPDVAEQDVVTTARILLRAGADADAGFLLSALPTPFTALTGALGSGERGRSDQPHHRHALALARVLLEAGADPNDGQALYNRMFDPDDSHLELMLEFGLGSGDGGPWHRLMPEATDSPTQMLRGQLSWAVGHGMTGRVELLALHGIDLDSPFDERDQKGAGRTPIELAMLSGQPDMVALLTGLGAAAADVDTEIRLVAALLAGDRAQVATLLARAPELLDEVRRRHPSLVLRAAVAGSRAAIPLLLGHGFDIDALGRQDLAVEQPWETALHFAAGEGDLGLAHLLLDAGADPNVRDGRFDATPLGWAENFAHRELLELLEPLTATRP